MWRESSSLSDDSRLTRSFDFLLLPPPPPTSPPPLSPPPPPPLLFLPSNASYYVTLSLIMVLLFFPTSRSTLPLPCGRRHHAAVAEVYPSATSSTESPAVHLCLLCSAVSRLFLLQHKPDAACHPLFIMKGAVHKRVALSASHLLSHQSASVSEALSAPAHPHLLAV